MSYLCAKAADKRNYKRLTKHLTRKEKKRYLYFEKIFLVTLYYFFDVLHCFFDVMFTSFCVKKRPPQ